MKLLSYDLETTGVEPQRDQILQIGAVVFDHEDLETPVERLPHFVTDVWHPRIEGSAYALQMNAWLLKRIATARPKPPNVSLALTQLHGFLTWYGLVEENKPVPVGFNVAAFDVAFTKAAGYDLFRHRAIELGTLLSRDGLPVGSRTACEEYLDGKKVAHDALEDARDAVRLYRCWKKGLVR